MLKSAKNIWEGNEVAIPRIETLYSHENWTGVTCILTHGLWIISLNGKRLSKPFVVLFQVNFQSPSEALGLQAGDVILAINGVDLASFKHKEAQEKIVKAGNNFQLTILR